MKYLIDLTRLAANVRSVTRPKSFRKVSDYSAAKRRNKLIDDAISLAAGREVDEVSEMKMLQVMQDLLSDARYRAESLGADNLYYAALSELGKAVDAQITRIEKSGSEKWNQERERARLESLEAVAKERAVRLQEPKVDIAEAWESLKKKMTSEQLRSISKFKSAIAAIEQVDLLLSNHPAVLEGGAGEREALESFLEAIWSLPVHSEDHDGMSGGIAAQSVCEAIANAAQYRLGQIKYEIDTRPENVKRAWDTPFA